MANDQIKLWHWLKVHQPDLHERVCDSLPQSVIQAYDASVVVIPKPDDIHRLNAELSAIEPLETNHTDDDNELNEPDCSSDTPPYTVRLLHDPLPCLAYYLLVFSDDSAAKLHAHLSQEVCQKIPRFIEELQPKLLPQSMRDRLEQYLLSDDSLAPKPQCTMQSKIEVMECLVDESMSGNYRYQSYFLNPQSDIQLFSQSDHHAILHTLMKMEYFTSFLAGLNEAQKNTWLKPLSTRQQTILLDDLTNHAFGAVEISQSVSNVIRCIRSLQKEGRIDATIKVFNP